MRLLLLVLISVLILTGCNTPASSTSPPAGPSPSPPPIPTGIEVAFPTPSLIPTDDPITPSPTPYIPPMTRLTEPGCCAQPFWSPDGQLILFIDQPQPSAEVGIYGVTLNGSKPRLISQQLALPGPDGHYQAYVNDRGQTIIEDVLSGVVWTIPNRGARVFFSPTSTRIAWTVFGPADENNRRKAMLYSAFIDGNESHKVVTVYDGGIAGWLDDDHLLVVGRENPDDENVIIFNQAVTSSVRHNLIAIPGIRSAQVSPGGKWIVYTVAPQTDAVQSEDGLWVLKADASQHFRLDVSGSVQWRDESHLLIIPSEPNELASHRLWQFDAESGEVVALTNPENQFFRVLAEDWRISPNGNYLVFVNAEDQALWLISLRPPE